jgi:hypothetical protein
MNACSGHTCVYTSPAIKCYGHVDSADESACAARRLCIICLFIIWARSSRNSKLATNACRYSAYVSNHTDKWGVASVSTHWEGSQHFMVLKDPSPLSQQVASGPVQSHIYPVQALARQAPALRSTGSWHYTSQPHTDSPARTLKYS